MFVCGVLVSALTCVKVSERLFLSDCGKVNVSTQFLKGVTCLNKPKRQKKSLFRRCEIHAVIGVKV